MIYGAIFGWGIMAGVIGFGLGTYDEFVRQEAQKDAMRRAFDRELEKRGK